MENKKLKLYRVVDHPFLEGVIGTNFPQYESLLYLGGYAMLKKWVKGDCQASNIYLYKCREDFSKYFFPFPEDAINFGNYLTTTAFTNILEYEFDYDKLPKLFGLGNYNTSSFGGIGDDSNMKAVETLVNLDELGGEVLNLKDLSKDEKLEMVRKMYIDSIRSCNYLRRIKGKHELEIDSKDGYKDIYQLMDFLNDCDNDMQILRTKAMTGNMFTAIRKGYSDAEHAIDFLRQQGLNLNFSEEAEQARLEIVKDLEYQYGTSDEEYWEKAKQKVLDYKRDFQN